jgi:hypothetical protein
MLGHREVFSGHEVEVQYLDFRSRILGVFRCFSQRHLIKKEESVPLEEFPLKNK